VIPPVHCGAETDRLRIVVDDLSGPQVAAFLEEHIREMRSITPPESKHALDLDAHHHRGQADGSAVAGAARITMTTAMRVLPWLVEGTWQGCVDAARPLLPAGAEARLGPARLGPATLPPPPP
jgi:hypothetical protein